MLGWIFGNRPQRHYEEGMRLYNRGELEPALSAFDKAIAGLHDDSHPYTALARFYRAETQARLGARLLHDGNFAQALRYLDAAIEEQPSYPDLHFRKGVAHMRLGDVDSAAAAARAALSINSEFTEARVLLSVVHREKDDRVAAAEELERARGTDRKRATALTRFLAQADREPTAEELWDHLFDEESLRRRIERAELLYHSGQLEESRSILADLVGENPTFPDLRLRLAMIESQFGRDDEALIHLEKALQLNPRFNDALKFSAAVLLSRDRVEMARVRYEEARQGGLPSPFADYGLAVCRNLLGDPEGCAALVRPLVGHGNTPIEALALLACSRAREGQIELAKASYADLLNHQPGPAWRLDAAAFYLDLGDEEAAYRFLEPLVPEPADPELSLAWATVLRLRGRDAESLAMLEEGLRTSPGEPALLLAAAGLHAGGGEAGLALRRLDELLGEWPECHEAHRLKVHVLRQEGRVREAEEGMVALRDTASADLEVELEQLHLLRQSGKEDEAAQLLERMQRFHPLDPRVRCQGVERWLAPLSARVEGSARSTSQMTATVSP